MPKRVAIVALLVGPLGIVVANWPYIWLVRQTGQLSTGGFLLSFLPMAGMRIVPLVVTIGGMVLPVLGVGLLLIRKRPWPRVRKWMLRTAIAGIVIVGLGSGWLAIRWSTADAQCTTDPGPPSYVSCWWTT